MCAPDPRVFADMERRHKRGNYWLEMGSGLFAIAIVVGIIFLMFAVFK